MNTDVVSPAPPAYLQVSLATQAICKAYGGLPVLEDATTVLARGEIVSLLGPSGSGKTTLAEILAGTARADAGRVLIGGEDVTQLPAHRRRIPLASQEWDLFPHLTALENVEFGLRVARVGRARRRVAAMQFLDRVGLAARADAFPHQLSGGQQQRIALARALLVPAFFVIVDEPFASVDQRARVALRQLLREEAAAGRGVLFITHDQTDALTLADRVICLVRGRVAMDGSPADVYARPPNLAVALLTGDAAELPLAVTVACGTTDPQWRSLPVAPASGLPARGHDRVIVRPEWLFASRNGDPYHVEGDVVDVQYRGDHFRLEVTVGTVRVPACSDGWMPTGTRARLSVRPGIQLPLVREP